MLLVTFLDQSHMINLTPCRVDLHLQQSLDTWISRKLFWGKIKTSGNSFFKAFMYCSINHEPLKKVYGEHTLFSVAICRSHNSLLFSGSAFGVKPVGEQEVKVVFLRLQGWCWWRMRSQRWVFLQGVTPWASRSSRFRVFTLMWQVSVSFTTSHPTRPLLIDEKLSLTFEDYSASYCLTFANFNEFPMNVVYTVDGVWTLQSQDTGLGVIISKVILVYNFQILWQIRNLKK